MIKYDCGVMSLFWYRLQPEGSSNQADKHVTTDSAGKVQKQLMQPRNRGLLCDCKLVM